MAIDDDIKQVKPFRSAKSRAIVNIIYTNNWMTFQQKKFLKKMGLSLETYNVLKILKGVAPQNVSINAIITRMLDKLSNASRLVDRLFDQGYVTRVTSEDDRRSVKIAITQSGIKALEKADAEMTQFENAFTGLTDDEATQLSALLDKLRSNN